uniref:Uncharacterized protein n=1 Tax=Triticum urartu TaxID=4572 RepID=A0A8R7JVV2_TRIUA
HYRTAARLWPRAWVPVRLDGGNSRAVLLLVEEVDRRRLRWVAVAVRVGVPGVRVVVFDHGGRGRRLLPVLLLDVANLHQLRVADLPAQRAGELDRVDAVADDHHLVLAVPGQRHRVHSRRGRHQRQRLGPAPAGRHLHRDHDPLRHCRQLRLYLFVCGGGACSCT